MQGELSPQWQWLVIGQGASSDFGSLHLFPPQKYLSLSIRNDAWAQLYSSTARSSATCIAAVIRPYPPRRGLPLDQTPPVALHAGSTLWSFLLQHPTCDHTTLLGTTAIQKYVIPWVVV